MRLKVHFKEEQDFKVDLKQSDTILHSDFGEIVTFPENNYNNLINKPSINGVELIGNKTAEDLDLGNAVFPSGGEPGDFLGINDSSEVAWLTPESGTIDYDELVNRPQINGVTLTGDVTAVELGLATPSDIPSLEPYRTAAEQDAIDSALESAIAEKYSVPSGGIPYSDMAAAVQSSLDRADAAIVMPSDVQNRQILVYNSNSSQWKASDLGSELVAVQKQTAVITDASGETIITNSSDEPMTFDDLINAFQASRDLEIVILNNDIYNASIGHIIDYDYGSATVKISFLIENENTILIFHEIDNILTLSEQLAYPIDCIANPYLASTGDYLVYYNNAWTAKPFAADSALSSSSVNPVQNKVIKQTLDNISAMSLPSGGEAGQILMKTSNVDYVTQWVSPASQAEQDNTRPITAAAVYATVGNIQQLLELI